ncbi:MAG: hypothetical protein TH68_09640, partial [Candidatus Synechococcus spongiarum 142]
MEQRSSADLIPTALNPLTHSQLLALQDWVGQLQRILQWEVDHDFVNSRGHSGHFAEVLARGLAAAPLAALRDSHTCGELRAGFSAYS